MNEVGWSLPTDTNRSYIGQASIILELYKQYLTSDPIEWQYKVNMKSWSSGEDQILDLKLKRTISFIVISNVTYANNESLIGVIVMREEEEEEATELRVKWKRNWLDRCTTASLFV